MDVPEFRTDDVKRNRANEWETTMDIEGISVTPANQIPSVKFSMSKRESEYVFSKQWLCLPAVTIPNL